MRLTLFKKTGTIAVLVMLFGTYAQAQFGAPQGISASSVPTEQLILPEQLNDLLRGGDAGKPLLLQVGSLLMFREAHIPGAEYAGAGSQAVGLQQLQARVAPFGHEKLIVLYCGCCPWNRCPNVGPAFKMLHDLGFTHVKVLYLSDNFGTNWVDKGYPVERRH